MYGCIYDEAAWMSSLLSFQGVIKAKCGVIFNLTHSLNAASGGQVQMAPWAGGTGKMKDDREYRSFPLSSTFLKWNIIAHIIFKEKKKQFWRLWMTWSVSSVYSEAQKLHWSQSPKKSMDGWMHVLPTHKLFRKHLIPLIQGRNSVRKWHHVKAGAGFSLRTSLHSAADPSKVLWGFWRLHETTSLWEAPLHLLFSELGGHG